MNAEEGTSTIARRADLGERAQQVGSASHRSSRPILYSEAGDANFSTPPSVEEPSASRAPERLPTGAMSKARWLVASGRPPRELDSFRVMQQWEGVVTAVNASNVIARVVDQTHTGLREEVEFAIDEIDPEDLSLVRPGAVFYWAIGYLDQIGRPRRTVSDIRFRRSLPPERAAVDAAREYARRLMASLGDDD